MMAADVISVDLPMTFKLRGGRKVIVLPDGTQGNPAPRATIDNTMIKAIARAFRWQKLLENGTYGCLEDIAKAEKIGASFCQSHHPVGIAGARHCGGNPGGQATCGPDVEGSDGAVSVGVGGAEGEVWGWWWVTSFSGLMSIAAGVCHSAAVPYHP